MNMLITEIQHSSFYIPGDGVEEINYDTNMKFSKFNAFGQISKAYLDEKLRLSLGLRTDFNNWSNTMLNPLPQLSPRFSASYSLTEKLNLNFNIGRYYQLPPYTAMGYKNISGEFVNRENDLKYIQSDHLVLRTGTYSHRKYSVDSRRIL